MGLDLFALGRLPEAIKVLRAALDDNQDNEERTNRAVIAGHLAQALQASGDLAGALKFAKDAVALVESGRNSLDHVNWHIVRKTTLGDILHQMGRTVDAKKEFEEAERLQTQLLYSHQGFWYCDLLLDLGEVDEVLRRATRTLKKAKEDSTSRDEFLDQVSLGRAHLLVAQRGGGGDLAEASGHLDDAVEGLRNFHGQDYLPFSLLARAALRTFKRDLAGALDDLEQACALAVRCGFRLHEADAHLGYARTFMAQGIAASAVPHIVRAKELIKTTGYRRRLQPLTDLEAELQQRA